MIRGLGLLVCVGTLSAATPSQRIDAILAGSKEARGGYWGIYAVELPSGKVLVQRNHRKFFVPASNAKLFTTALAFEQLGPDYRATTRLTADRKPDSEGRVRELRVIGAGDPNLSARVLPYDRDRTGPNPLASIEALAEQAIAAGLRHVEGDIVGDDTAYVYEPYPEGWSADDPTFEYGAPVSALAVNDNALELRIEPADQPGMPARISFWPAIEHLVVHNRTTTVATDPARIRLERLPGSRELTVSGTVVRAREEIVAVADPALFAAEALRDALLERGVTVAGSVRAVHRTDVAQAPPLAPDRVELGALVSGPLQHALQVINKVSQNLHTELILREVARTKHGVGSLEGGLKEIENFLERLGVPANEVNFEDASGLSRLTLVTPSAVMAILRHMYGSQHREAWMATLPVGGIDGTLEKRFARSRFGRNVQAKTGSISHVSALSGYVRTRQGGTVAFSIMANNYNSAHAPVRAVIDRIVLALGGY